MRSATPRFALRAASYKPNLGPLRLTLGILLGSVLFLGCGGYGKVSPETYEFAKALYSATNRQSTESLDRAEEMVLAARDAQELPAEESAWLLAIVADARNGDWEGANREARRLMTDQVEPGDTR